jgi:hypothetical protein
MRGKDSQLVKTKILLSELKEYNVLRKVKLLNAIFINFPTTPSPHQPLLNEHRSW